MTVYSTAEPDLILDQPRFEQSKICAQAASRPGGDAFPLLSVYLSYDA